MYHHVEGTLTALGAGRAVVDAGGVGYECRIPLSTYSALKGKEGSRVKLLLHLQVLEDDLRLYGFATDQERELFRLATSITGVGPTIALAALATFDPAAFAGAIASGDSRALLKIKGVGPKLSERLILELRDRAGALAALSGAGGGRPASAGRADAVRQEVIADAIALLVQLGYGSRDATAKVEAAVAKLIGAAGEGKGDRGASLDVEVIVQTALRTR